MSIAVFCPCATSEVTSSGALLFPGCRYGGLEDFEKGVRELVGAPHPQVWDEINKEHMQRGDESTREFNPGNYDTKTCSRDEFLVVIDPAKGKEVSKGKRCALRLSFSVSLCLSSFTHTQARILNLYLFITFDSESSFIGLLVFVTALSRRLGLVVGKSSRWTM